jgi:hypothetical protein
MAGPALPTNTVLVATVTIDQRSDVCPMDRYRTIGVVEGMGSQVCVMGAILTAGAASTESASTAGSSIVPNWGGPLRMPIIGTVAFRYLAPGYLGMLGEIIPASASRLAYSVSADWPIKNTSTFLVEGWMFQSRFLAADTAFCSGGGSPVPAGDPLDPNGSDPCVSSWLDDTPDSPPSRVPDGLVVPKSERSVEAAGMGQIDALPVGREIQGVYVVQPEMKPCTGPAAPTIVECSAWKVLARVGGISIPEPGATSPSVPSSASASAPVSASQSVASASPALESSGPWNPAWMGLLGLNSQPLTEPEFAAMWAADPAHLNGKTAIVRGPVPAGFTCRPTVIYESAPSRTCQASVNEGQIGEDGRYWAVRVGADGKLSVVGEIATPSSGYVFTLDQLNAATELKDGDLVMVQGWLLESMPTCNLDISPLPDACGPYSENASTASDNSPAWIGVQRGAYQQITGTTGDATAEGPPVYGIFLVRNSNSATGTVLASLAATAAP